MTISELLTQCGLPLLEARMLAARVLDKNSAWLIAHGDEAAGAETEKAFAALAGRRRKGEPMAYVLGRRR